MGKPTKHEGFWTDFRKFFGRGLAILLPSVLTLWILWQLFVFVYQNVGAPINRGIRTAVIEILPLFVDEDAGGVMPEWWSPTDAQVGNYLETRRREGHRVPLAPIAGGEGSEEYAVATTEARELLLRRGFRVSPIAGGEGSEEYAVATTQARELLRRRGFRDWWNAHWYLEAAGLFAAILLIYLAGLILGNLLGRKLYSKLEKVLVRMPGFKQIFPHVKQVVDLIAGDRAVAFKSAVIVEYPRKGMWTVGFVTGTSLQSVRDEARSDCVSVFIPSTPAPFTGFTINVRQEDAIELPITIDQAIRFIITGGVLNIDDATRPAVGAIEAPGLPEAEPETPQ